MKSVSKFMTGAAAAALIAVSTATPAMARDWDHHHGGISTGEAIAGIAIIGGAAAIATALTSDSHRYGYDYRYRYQGGYTAAVNSCGYEADRYGRGRVRITDVDRKSYDRYRVRGVIEGGYGRSDNGWGGYGRGDRYDRYDSAYRSGGYGQVGFTCVARSDGRVTDFRTDRGYRW